jgi:hypothetical protein
MTAFTCSLEILRANRDALEAAAQTLLEKETLEEAEVEALLRDLVQPPCVHGTDRAAGALAAPTEEAPDEA